MEIDSVYLVRSIEYRTEIKRQFGFCFLCLIYGERIPDFCNLLACLPVFIVKDKTWPSIR